MRYFWRYLSARRVLGWAAACNIMSRLWRRRRPDRWLTHMASEGLGTTPPAAWDNLAASGACVGCGACALVVPAALRPGDILRVSARQPGEALAALAALRQLLPYSAAIAQICPTGVEVDRVVAVVEAQARQFAPSANREEPL